MSEPSLADEFEEEWDFRVPPTSLNRLLRDRILAALRVAEIVRETVRDEAGDTRRVIDIGAYESWARKVCATILALASEAGERERQG